MSDRTINQAECLLRLDQAILAAERAGRHRNRKNADHLYLAQAHAREAIQQLAACAASPLEGKPKC